MTEPARKIQGEGRKPAASFPSTLPAAPVPVAVDLINDAAARDLQAQYSKGAEEFLKNLTVNKLLAVIPKIFSEGDFQVLATFNHTRLDLPNSALDLELAEGAAVCFGMQSKAGQLSIPEPIALLGFAAKFWIFYQLLTGVKTDEDGNVAITAPCFDKLKDITPEVMASPLGELFPEKKARPVPLKNLVEFIEKFLQEKSTASTPTAGSPADEMLSHLDRLVFSALLYQAPAERPLTLSPVHGGVCHATAASLNLALKVPLLKDNLQKRLYENFDFQGVEEFSLRWPRFPLAEFLKDGAIRIASGDISLTANLSESGESLQVQLNFQKAQIVWEEILGAQPVELDGSLRIVLKKGGEITVAPSELKVRIPVFPSSRYPLLAFSGTLDGPLSFKKAGEGVKLLSSGIAIKDFELKTREGQSLVLPESAGELSGQLGGYVWLRYDPSDPFQNFTSLFNVDGRFEILPKNSKKITKIAMEDFHWQGWLSLAQVGEKIYPNLSLSSVDINTQVVLYEGAKDFLTADRLWLQLRGGERKETGGEVLQNGILKWGADGIYVGQFAWKPSASAKLQTRQAAGGFTLDGQGDWDLDSIEPRKKLSGDAKILPPFTDIGTPFTFSTDGKTLDWHLNMDLPQSIGPVKLEGDLTIDGKDTNFQIATVNPMTVLVHGKKVVQGLRVKGGGDDVKTRITVQFANLADLASGRLSLQSVGGERLSGSYRLASLKGALPRSKEFNFAQVQAEGSLSTPPWDQLLEKPRVYLKGGAEAELQGSLQGKLSSDYRATLLYQPPVERNTRRGPREFPANFQVIFGSKGASRIKLGPLKGPEGDEVIRGSSQLKGTLILTPLRDDIVLGGNELGIEKGTIFLGGQSTAALSHLTIDAEQLWGIHRGVARGRSLRLESDVNLEPFLKERAEGLEPEALQRHVKWIVDRQPLSLDAFWRLLLGELKKPASNGGLVP